MGGPSGAALGVGISSEELLVGLAFIFSFLAAREYHEALYAQDIQRGGFPGLPAKLRNCVFVFHSVVRRLSAKREGTCTLHYIRQARNRFAPRWRTIFCDFT